MRLLFVTQKLHGQDAFAVLWVRALQRRGFDVTVLCLETDGTLYEFPVFSLGKEKGLSRVRMVCRFQSFILTTPYDRVFVHMAPVYYAMGCWWWVLRRIPCYLWYTHYRMQIGVRLFGWFGRRFFCATPQSLPQYVGNPKKVVIGHGIDLAFWPQRRNETTDPHRLLVVHRLSRSKRLELALHALTHLEAQYILDIYGIEAEPDYVRELHALVTTLQLGSRVHFHGSVPMQALPTIYCQHRLILNMASETIDKTMVEAMTCGCYPVTTAANAHAIGLPHAPASESPAAIAAYIERALVTPPLSADAMYRIVKERHSLEGLVECMAAYMQEGR